MLVRIEEIIIEERQRQAVGDIEELEKSIEEVGLLHPIVLRRGKKGPTLVAGFRRLTAVSNLHSRGKKVLFCNKPIDYGTIPATWFDEMSIEEAAKAELYENIYRLDLTWKERALAIAAIHRLKTMQNSDWTIEDTGKLLAEQSGVELNPYTISNKILLASHLDDPEIAKAKNEREALKRMFQLSMNDIAQEIVRRKRETWSVQCMDCRAWLAGLNKKSVDVVITDPPYGIEVDRQALYGSSTPHTYNDSWADVSALLHEAIGLLYDVCKDNSRLLVFCSPRRFAELRKIVDGIGWDVWPVPLIWYKENGIAPVPDIWPRRTYDTILIARKGNRTMKELHDVIVARQLDREEGPEKPAELAKKLVSAVAWPGETLIDPFCGTGVFLVEGLKYGLNVMGCDIEPRMVTIAQENLAKCRDMFQDTGQQTLR
jgi:DNA modification methylase